jgi:putative metallohydrolase (TIGR04338 family)
LTEASNRAAVRGRQKGVNTTKLQEAAYNAQLAAGLPTSVLARAMLIPGDGVIGYRDCARYLHAVQRLDWFTAAFPSYSAPVTVVGGRGVSRADAVARQIKIGVTDRHDAGQCEQACLHELAHIVTPDYGPGRELREPGRGRDSSKGHHHAWRANYVLIVRMMLGKEAAQRLRAEFNAWGLITHR